MKRSQPALLNRILTACGAVLLAVLSVISIRNAFVSSIALEQAAQCGVEEHIHTDSCYASGLLQCTKPRHTHSRNCYLLLLKDNNINNLLTQIDAEESHSLESLLYETVDSSLSNLQAAGNPAADPVLPTYASGQVITVSGAENLLVMSQAPQSDGSAAIQETDIAVLNENIGNSGIVLNENLSTAAAIAETPGDTAILMSASGTSSQVSTMAVANDYGISTLAVGATPSENNLSANFYVHLDGEWQCIGGLNFSVVRNANRYYTARVSTTSVNSLINNTMGSSFTANTLYLTYGASANASSWSEADINSTYVIFGDDYFQQNSARQAKYVRLVDSNLNPLSYYTVTLQYENGTTESKYVRSRSSFTLPGDTAWTAGGNIYAAGDSVTISGTTTFVATTATSSQMQITYNLNFPSLGYVYADNYTVYNPATPPTLAGTSVTTITDRVEENSSATVRAVSSNTVTSSTNHAYGHTYPVRFMGWETETGEIISASTNLSWAALESYANGDRTVTLTGVWTHGTRNMVNFFVLYNARVDEATGDSEHYTPSIFSTHVGGTIDTSFNMDARTDEAAYQNDGVIRNMYGSSSGSMWWDSFPDDNYIFQQLQQYATSLTVEGVQVNSEDLNTSAYAIRWYKVVYHSDGWHIDGKLVRKKGQITVDKKFFGNADIIQAAESGFFIEAVNGTLDAGGNFLAYSSSDSRYHQHILVLDEATKNALQSTYPNAVFHVYDSNSHYSDGEGYEWLIENVELGEHWRITEHPVDVPGSMYYAEYSAYDTDGTTTAIAEYGTDAYVIGKTFALDEDPDQGLLVDFRNYYYPVESILIKKEDADTGQAIGNAVFELWQYNSENVLTPLMFSYNAANNQYEYANDGTISRITTGDAGFTTIMTTGFSYSHGPLVVKEVISPTGYAAAPNVTLAEGADGISISSMAYENGTVVTQEHWPEFAEVYKDGSTLIIKNHSTATTSLTVDKVWADDAQADSVTVVLQAMGTTATNLFPGLSNVRAELSAANNWQYTWTDLPTYANGEPVVWSVKEILVGDETAMADGISFANWTVVYSQPTQTDSDSDGIVDHWQYTVTNSVRRAQLYLVKTNPDGEALSGANFELVEVNASGAPVSGAIVHTGTTDENGLLKFDNLKYTTRYRLIETSPPAGYLPYREAAYLTLAADGTVTVEAHGQVTAGAYAYVVRVVNHAPLPLPVTGGSGTVVFYGLGGALVLITVCGYILPKRKRRKEVPL